MHGPGSDHGRDLGLYDPAVIRSRAGVRAVGLSLLVLVACAAVQGVVYVLSGSVALLADLIHNVGDAATAVPVGIAFALRSRRAEAWSGVAVVAALLASAVFTGYESVQRFIEPSRPSHLLALAAAGLVGFAGNLLAARIRTRAGEKLGSAALVADGQHARADAFVSLGVVASAIVVSLGLDLADPLIGLAITAMILRITVYSWREIRADFAALSRPEATSSFERSD
ncbi:MAG: cation diffusion facilitator family transporter [Actinomycetes bacterium]